MTELYAKEATIIYIEMGRTNVCIIMASKVFHLLLITSLVFSFFFSCFSHASFPKSISGIRSFPVEFLKKSIGAQKGDEVAGLHELKTYLSNLGYFDHKISKYDDIFDDSLELAIKKYQTFYRLNVTGVLDSNTVEQMKQSRCGVSDSPKSNATSGLLFSPQYAFFSGNPKWPMKKLTYSFPMGTRKDALDAIAHAFGEWASVTDFEFNYIDDYHNADIKLQFTHLDGPWNVLADATPPTDGKVRFDVDEDWSAFVEPDKFDLQSIGLHELGHVLGLAHSTVSEAVMFPTFGPGERKHLSSDDINGIKTLYGLKKNFE